MFTVNITDNKPHRLILTIIHGGVVISLTSMNPAEAIASATIGEQGSLISCYGRGWFHLSWDVREIVVESKMPADSTGKMDVMRSIIPSTNGRIARLLSALYEWRKLVPGTDISHVSLRQPVDGLCYSIMLLGESGVGKDAFVHKLKTNRFTIAYEPTCVQTNSHIDILTSIGPVHFGVINVAGKPDGDWAIGLYTPKDIDAAIIMFDVIKPDSFDAVEKWQRKLTDHKINVPTLVVGNKTDRISSYIELKPKDPAHKLISVFHNEGLMDVLISLLCAIRKDPTIKACSADSWSALH